MMIPPVENPHHKQWFFRYDLNFVNFCLLKTENIVCLHTHSFSKGLYHWRGFLNENKYQSATASEPVGSGNLP